MGVIGTLEVLSKSIVSSDIGILIVAILELSLFVLTMGFAKTINADDIRADGKSGSACRSIVRIYSVFVTGISIFPLLGMLGTVFGLLGLDLANGDMENIKANFFIALTSTAWGIIFSLLFKLLNAAYVDYIEDTIKLAKDWLDTKEKEGRG